jgi:hypothetical protein
VEKMLISYRLEKHWAVLMHSRYFGLTHVKVHGVGKFNISFMLNECVYKVISVYIKL